MTAVSEKIVWDRYSLLTQAMSGNWLPDERRGFGNNNQDGEGPDL